MGRVKLQIKKIENNTNRQVTFSKRRNGLIKKAYELSVLCDVDVALVLFSPSGRVSVFSGNKSIEDILERYIDLPEHDRGRLQNQEYLQRALGKLKYEADPMFQTGAASSPVSMIDAQVEDMQQEIYKCKCQIEDMEKKLMVYECNPAEIATLCEAEYREQVLEENLKHVRLRKHFLQDHYNSASQVINLASENVDLNVLGSRHPDMDILEWLPQRSPQVQILNFLDSNGLLPLRDQNQRLDTMLPLTLHAPTLNVYNHMSPGRSVEDNSQRPPFGQAIDVNLSPWADQLYSTGTDNFTTAVQPREHALELFLSQLTPGDQNHL